MSSRKLKRQKKKKLQRNTLPPKQREELKNALSSLQNMLGAGLHTEAENIFSEIMAFRHVELETLGFLSSAAMQLKKPDTSIQLLKKACSLYPKHVDSLYDLGIRSAECGMFEDAADAFSKAVALSPHDPEIHYNLGRAKYDLREYVEAEKALKKTISLKPGYIEAYNNLGLVYEATGDLQNAVASFKKVLDLNPGHERAQLKVNKILSDAVPAWHFPMLNDLNRNATYEKAMHKAIHKGNTVLDIGTGSGLLSMLAARAGAKAVYTCETNPLIAEKAKEIINKNGFKDTITVINRNSLNLDTDDSTPSTFDVIIAEIFDAGLLGEGVLKVFQHATDKLLAPGGQLIPCKATVFAALVESRELWQEGCVEMVNDLDFNLFNEFSPWPYMQKRLSRFDHQLRSEPKEIFNFDFTSVPENGESKTVNFVANNDGLCHAISFWFRLHLDDEYSIDTSPTMTSHWNQSVQLLNEPLKISAGQEILITANHNTHFISFTYS